MLTLKKQPDKDFIILNITDPQLGDPEWADGHINRQILEYTIRTLIEKCKPDLITVSGDLAWAGYTHAYTMLADYLESFQIPWAPIWGNHDNQNGAAYIDEVASRYLTYPHCLYEKGNPALGNGNYVIRIEENGKIVEALIMMDSHDKADFTNEQGETTQEWAKLYPTQIEWYKQQSALLKAEGCKDATLILHIPLYAYRTASLAAFKDGIALNEVTLAQSEQGECWKDEYKNSVGVQHENISSYPTDDGVFAVLKQDGLVKHILAGHDHVNNWIILHEGIKMIFALKTGAGCYWEPAINGGTVFTVNQDGVSSVNHEYVDISHLIK